MKTKYDTLGYQRSCVNYDPCPLCWGCRAYDPSYKKCEMCETDAKQNICNKKKHTPQLLAKMIRRTTIRV